jgi:hypothetical protein
MCPHVQSGLYFAPIGPLFDAGPIILETNSLQTVNYTYVAGNAAVGMG